MAKLKWPNWTKQSDHMADYTKGLKNSTVSFFIAVPMRKI